MTQEEAKKAVVLNCSIMCGDIGKTIQEKLAFIHRFFDSNPGLSVDEDLRIINEQFYKFFVVFKALDANINQLGEKLK